MVKFSQEKGFLFLTIPLKHFGIYKPNWKAGWIHRNADNDAASSGNYHIVLSIQVKISMYIL